MRTILGLAAPALLCAGGCTSIAYFSEADPAWKPHPSHASMRPYHLEIEQSRLAEACKSDVPVLGCAIRLPRDRVCIIYTGPKPAPWIVRHELKHCAGYDHP